MARIESAYDAIIRTLFSRGYRDGVTEVPFEREDIRRVAKRLAIKAPDNLGDVVYSFRYRRALPEAIRSTAPPDHEWHIATASKSSYVFVLRKVRALAPNENLAETKIPDATPGVIAMYALDDEQALLAKLRYNRLIDIFTGVASYSLQSHLRSTIGQGVQVETDEIYVGVDKKGVHHIFPVQAKGGRDKLGWTQIEQDLALCGKHFSSLLCTPIAAQFMAEGVIALFSFQVAEGEIRILDEKHYKLIPLDETREVDFAEYRNRLP